MFDWLRQLEKIIILLHIMRVLGYASRPALIASAGVFRFILREAKTGFVFGLNQKQARQRADQPFCSCVYRSYQSKVC